MKRFMRTNYKSIILIIICLSLLFGISYVFFITVPPHKKQYSFQGEGTEKSPYIIATLEDLIQLRNEVNSGNSFSGSIFNQTADIDLISEDNWEPIGIFGTERYFAGTYDGQGHVLTNLHINDPEKNVALFGVLCGKVCNLGIESGEIHGAYIGSIASHGKPNAVIFNCFNKANLFGEFRVGGIADNFAGEILYCWNLGEISCRENALSGNISSYCASIIRGCHGLEEPLVSQMFIGEVENSHIITNTNTLQKAIDFTNNELRMFIENEERNNTNVLLTDVFLLDNTSDGKELRFSNEKYTLKREKTNIIHFFDGNEWIFIFLFNTGIFTLVYCFRKHVKEQQTADNDFRTQFLKRQEKDNRASVIIMRGQKCQWIESFLALFFAIVFLWISNIILLYKRNDGITTMENYYSQKEGTVDVLLLGSSRAGVNLDCEVLWKEEGISSYALWGSIQPLWSSYYFFNEAIKYNKPQIAVLEVREAMFLNDYSDQSRQYINTFGLRFSLDKIEAIQASAPQESWLDLLLGFPIYHTRYDSLEKTDFTYMPWAEDKENNKGTGVRYGSGNRIELISAEGISSICKMTDKSEFYLNKIIELARKNDIELVLIATPYEDSVAAQPYLNYIQEKAIENDISFLNYNQLYEETGLCIEDFYTDNSHLNTNGARKVSKHLGKWLKDHYSIDDHRGDARYKSWDCFAQMTENEYYSSINDLNDYINEIKRNERMILLIKWEINNYDSNFLAFCNQLMIPELSDTLLTTEKNQLYFISDSITIDNIVYMEIDEKKMSEIDHHKLNVDYQTQKLYLDDKELLNLQPGVICVVMDSQWEKIDIARIYNPENIGFQDVAPSQMSKVTHLK